jgi:predicted transcriptional regulator
MANVLQIEVNDQLMAKLQALADDMGRSVEEIHAFALEDGLDVLQGDFEDYLAGKKDIEAGRYVTQEQMREWLLAYGTENALPRPEPKHELSRAG